MQTPDGRQRKLIVFTEHRDTLNYLLFRTRGLLGRDEAVVTIHGGVNRDDRRKVQEEFRNNPDVQVLLATDAAGEGVNLQCQPYACRCDGVRRTEKGAWCPGEDSNLQGSLHWYLKPARLPIPPPGQGEEMRGRARKARKSTGDTSECQ